MLQESKSCEKVRLFLGGKGETFSFLQDQEFLSIAKENMIWKMWLVNEFNRRSSYFKWMKKLVCQMSTFCQNLSTAVLMLIQNVYLVYNFCPFCFGNRKATNDFILWLIYFRKSVTTLINEHSQYDHLSEKWNIFLKYFPVQYFWADNHFLFSANKPRGTSNAKKSGMLVTNVQLIYWLIIIVINCWHGLSQCCKSHFWDPQTFQKCSGGVWSWNPLKKGPPSAVCSQTPFSKILYPPQP